LAIETDVFEKTCANAILLTINPTLIGMGLNPGRRGKDPETSLLRMATDREGTSYSTVQPILMLLFLS
jgi:hypothetical protein